MGNEMLLDLEEMKQKVANGHGLFKGAFQGFKAGNKDAPLGDVAKALMNTATNKGLGHFKMFVFADDTFMDDMPVYREKDGLVVEITEDWMETHIAQETGMSRSKSKELWHLIKKEMFDTPAFSRKRSNIVAVGFADSQDLCWSKLGLNSTDLLLNPVTLDQIPEFSEFLDLCASPEDRRAFILFAGSLFDPKSSKHQYLHLYGQGGEGKSAFTEVLKKIFTDRSSYSIRSGDLSGTHFGMSLEGKRLLLFEDENNPGFVQSGMFKKVTGESTMTIEPKFKAPRSISLMCKVIITSNSQVQIGGDNADKRRLISVRLNQAPANRPHDWKTKFVDSADLIAAYVIQEYQAAVTAEPSLHVYLPAPEANTKLAIESNYEEWDEALQNLGVVVTQVDADRMTKAELHKLVEGMTSKMSNKDRSDFKKYLESKGVITKMVRGCDHYVGIKKSLAALANQLAKKDA